MVNVVRTVIVAKAANNNWLRRHIDRCRIQARNRCDDPQKKSHAYAFSPKSMAEKGRVTARFLERNVAEYELPQQGIQSLKDAMVRYGRASS